MTFDLMTFDYRHIPTDPGIYLFLDKKGEILYIGKAKNLHKRVAQYFNPNSLRKQDMLANAHSVDFLIVKTESEALYLEDNLIKKHKPRYNNLLKADNSYVYIKITNEDFPQIYITRKKNQNQGLSTLQTGGPSTYIGPKHNTMELKKFMQYLRQVLQFRGCKPTQFRQGKLCSDYHFGLCKGRCVLAKGETETRNKKLEASSKNPVSSVQNPVSEYQKIIKIIESFFRGNTSDIEKEIKNQIAQSVKNQNFEWAAKLRDIYLHIQQLVEKQTVVINKPVTGYIFKIKNIGNFLIYCVVNFYEGKLIDVIRGKESVDDTDIAGLLASLSNEFGGMDLVNEGRVKKLTSSNNPLTRKLVNPLTDFKEMLGMSKNIKKLSKSDIKEVDSLIERFFDSFIMSTTFAKENLNNDLLGDLQTRYGLKKFPYRIECVDISHLSGGRVSGGLSCLLGGLRNFKGYRRYKISGLVPSQIVPSTKNKKDKNSVLGTRHGVTKVDDYASLKEILLRRIANKTELPDLMILDGGKGQLGIVKKLDNLPSSMQIVALGKGEARKKSKIGKRSEKSEKVSEKLYFFDDKMKIHSKDLQYDQVDKILLQARNEAHRFANTYREKQMKMEFA